MTTMLDALQMHYARLMAEHEATQSKLKSRVTRLEKKVALPLIKAPPPPTPEKEEGK